MEIYFLIFVCIGIPVLIGSISFIISDVSESKQRNEIMDRTSWNYENKPNFRERSKYKPLFNEGYKGSEIPEFTLDSPHAEIPEFNLDEQKETVEKKGEKTNNISFEHSTPTPDMEAGIEELLEKTSQIDVTEQETVSEEYHIPSAEQASPMPQEETDEFSEATLSPLGENYYFVSREFGSKVANAVTASPDFALEQGVDYVLFGKVKGEFLNSFGESLRLQGLPEKQEANDEYLLIKGNFITAELFHVVETISAERASKGEGDFNFFTY